nr:immunoglobulin heavy chain junction region [Macaca mulatta]
CASLSKATGRFDSW